MTPRITDKTKWQSRFPELPRFIAKVEKTDKCWLWIGAKVPRGYGVFTVGSKIDGTHRNIYAHRWIYQHIHGAVPLGLEIDHLCSNPKCVNPAHLEAVTRKENLLRSNSLSTINAKKEVCVRGHRYDAENTYFTKKGHRKCRACPRSIRVERRESTESAQ